MAEPQLLLATPNNNTSSSSSNSISNNFSDSDWNFQQHNYYYEDESQPQDDDPYVYSDDSASLSDTYFRQTDSPSPSPIFPLAQIQAPTFIPYHHSNNSYPYYDKAQQQQQLPPHAFGTTNRSCFWRTHHYSPLSSENDPLVGNGEAMIAASYGSDRSVASSTTTESSLLASFGLPGFRKHDIYGIIQEDVPVMEEKEDLSALYRHHQQQQQQQQQLPPLAPAPAAATPKLSIAGARSPSPSLFLATANHIRKYPPSERQVPPPQQQQQQLQQQQQQQQRLQLLSHQQYHHHHQRRIQILEHKQRRQLARELAVSKVRGQSQESTTACSMTSFTDVWCAVLFLLHLAVIFYFTFSYFLSGYKNTYDPTTLTSLSMKSSFPTAILSDDRLLSGMGGNNNFLNLVAVTGCFAGILSFLSFGFMLIVARAVIQIILFVSIVLSLVWTILGWAVQQQKQQQLLQQGSNADAFSFMMMIPWLGGCALALALGYTLMVWNRIDLAATNLYTALCAMRCTADIAMLGLVSVVVSFAWCYAWSMAALGIHQACLAKCDEGGENCGGFPLSERYATPLYVFLGFSFYWTVLVIKNVVRVVVASTVGTWWFHPKTIGPCCTNAVRKPLIRSLTKSFGSICLGSLVVFPAQTAMFVVSCCCRHLDDRDIDAPQESTNNGKQCDTETTEVNKVSTSSSSSRQTDSPKRSMAARFYHLLRCCNRWSYTYIGMYGYSFAKGGEKAIQLFETREWLEVVNENLPRNVLLMASLVIGGSTGCFAVLVEELSGVDFSTFEQPVAAAFGIGSVLGFCLSNVLLLGVVGSAVNTILVCFAAGPFEFNKNHPRLSREMREVWSQQVWEPPV